MNIGLFAFTVAHVALSLVAIVSGLVWLAGLLGRPANVRWTHVFLATTTLTTLTGFLLPFSTITPAVAFGLLSTALLAVALAAYYRYHLAGVWRPVFIVTALFALYLNVFVLVVQSFLKIGPLHLLAPTGSEPPFAAVQAVVLLLFVIAGFQAFRRSRRVIA
ncbi:hypothetical protein [Aquibium oceanicum]|uniref:DUF2306 domain-containing protein n=1 Tax=Aquibium oceanicum TaxID=1670800 RepID=A0A1L3SLP9_9HYPH|nr:hypothetical protein [Aquibium oceanicum]APH70328.1 hypothetical protein BSQ44_02205 [Aquibium oceanicum]